MSAPRTKRQFAGAASDPAQRHITSFFHKSPSCPSVAAAAPATSPLSSPALPASVQSNLLSVGMRVRKSVPEGYKTGSTYGGFALWADADPGGKNGGGASLSGSASAPSAAAAAAARRELLPFCGIHKVGGLAAQPAFEAAPPLPADVFAGASSSLLPGLDDVPSLTSSQDSVASSGAPPPTRKRLYSDDDDDNDDGSGAASGNTPYVSDRLRVRRADWLDGEVSPRSVAPPGWENARVVAEPRRRRAGVQTPRKALGGGGGAGPLILSDLGQENMSVDDFGEAEFLDFRWAAGDDLDMGGV